MPTHDPERLLRDSRKLTLANCPANRRHPAAHYLGNIVPGVFSPVLAKHGNPKVFTGRMVGHSDIGRKRSGRSPP
jgi:hypothetical protein